MLSNSINKGKEKKRSRTKKLQNLRINHQEMVQKHIEKWELINKVGSYSAEISLYAAKQPDDVKFIMKQYCDYVELLFDKKAFLVDILN